MHQQNPVDAPPESRGTTRIRRTPTESCFHLQRGYCQSSYNNRNPALGVLWSWHREAHRTPRVAIIVTIASPDDQHIIGSPLEILPVQKHKNNSNFLKYFHSFGLAIPNYWQSCMFFSLWLTDWHLRHDAILRLIIFLSKVSFFCF